MRSRSWLLAVVAMSVLVAGSLAWGLNVRGHSSKGSTGAAQGGTPEPDVATGPQPKAIAEELEHDFGYLDPSEPCRHEFVICNVGAAPLLLQRGGTSCKCTMSELPGGAIPAGSQATVALASKIDQKQGAFHHTAAIFTNDPQRREIVFTIRGTIRAYLAAEPGRLVLAPAKDGGASQTSTVVYSQVWPEFALSGIFSTRPGIQWSVRPAEGAALAEAHARSGYRLEVAVPGELLRGSFYESLHLTAQPADKSPPRELKVDVSGEVESRVMLYGDKIVPGGILRLGLIEHGEGRREPLTLKVYDEHRQLKIDHIETVPDFLRVRVEAFSPQMPRLGLYRVEVEVPGDAPESNFMGVRKGEFRVYTDHPKAPVVKLRVEFAVLGADAMASR